MKYIWKTTTARWTPFSDSDGAPHPKPPSTEYDWLLYSVQVLALMNNIDFYFIWTWQRGSAEGE